MNQYYQQLQQLRDLADGLVEKAKMQAGRNDVWLLQQATALKAKVDAATLCFKEQLDQHAPQLVAC